MPPGYTLTGPGIAADQVKLGQLVTNIWDPTDPSHNPPKFDSCSPKIQESTRYESQIHYHSNTHSSILLKLAKVFGIGRGRSSNVSLKIEAKSTGTQLLSNYTDVLRSLQNDDDGAAPSSEGGTTTRGAGMERTWEWIQNRLQDEEDVYMVVGIRTVTDAIVAVEESSDAVTALKAGVPLTDLATHGLSAPLGLSALDVMIAMTVGKSGGMSEIHKLKGTWVMAVQYCRVKVEKRRRRDVARLVAGSTTWEWFTGRGSRTVTTDTPEAPQDRIVVAVALGEMVDAAEVTRMNEEGDDLEGGGDRIESFAVDGIELLF